MEFVVTAGPTRERIDPVRFLSNPSTGKMGFAVAEAALKAGCRVTLVAGPVSLDTPRGARRVDVESAREMLEAVLSAAERALAGGGRIALVMTAAVADWRPARCAAAKLKKTEMSGVLRLVRNPDILKTVSRRFRGEARRRLVLAGFAAETGDPLAEAARKCREKKLDFIVANDVSEAGSGFGTDTDRATFIFPDGRAEPLPLLRKSALARRIVAACLAARPEA